MAETISLSPASLIIVTEMKLHVGERLTLSIRFPMLSDGSFCEIDFNGRVVSVTNWPMEDVRLKSRANRPTSLLSNLELGVKLHESNDRQIAREREDCAAWPFVGRTVNRRPLHVPTVPMSDKVALEPSMLYIETLFEPEFVTYGGLPVVLVHASLSGATQSKAH